MLFNFEGPEEGLSNGGAPVEIWGCSSVGRAPALQAGGRQFESVHLHQPCKHGDTGEPNGEDGRESATEMGS